MDRKIEKKKWPPKRIAKYSIIGAFALFVLFNLPIFDRTTKLNVDAEKITISTVTKGPFQEYIPITGTVIPIKTVYLDAVEGGRVKEIFAEAGSFVKKGDKILRLENTDLLLDLMFREAELFQQSNNLRNTRLAMEQNRLKLKEQLIELDYQIQRLGRLYERNKVLLNKNLISRQEFEQVKDEYEYYRKRKEVAIESFQQDSLFRQVQIQQLESSLKRMESNLKIIKEKFENLTIRAPVSGQLTSLNVESVGEIKSPGERLGQIDVLEGFKVRAEIDEHYLPRIEIGLPGEFDFAGSTYKLVSKKIYPEIREGRFKVDLEFAGEQPEGLRRGQTLHIRLQLGHLEEAILLPRGGFYQKTGGQWVYVVDPSGEFATKRKIRLGRQNPQVFEVLEGLQPGERVITSSYDNFGDMEKLILR
ncbi:MAG: HlyD family efflux transporter periplasmic adaptor subunit [Calditrichaeota bacterium]|nr:MAG: HlyD family efflux transporter periplasmic adaptor subunit [Calditrichota bacterium]